MEQLAKSWEKMFYINTCTYKLAEGHEHCTQGQNLLGHCTPGRGEVGRPENCKEDGCLLKSLSARGQPGKPGSSLARSPASPGHLRKQVQSGTGAQSRGKGERPGCAAVLRQLAICFKSRFTQSPSLGQIFTPSTLLPPISPPNSRK